MSTPDNAIAVVGMAGKFPGANNVSAYWDNLRRGKESIVTLSEQQLKDAGISDKALANPAYVRRAPIVDGVDEFDADFFGFPPLLARSLDPQHRLFLQCAWHALEDAGCDPARFDGSIGVYGTSSPSGYLLHNLLSHHDPNAVLAEGLNWDQLSMFLQNDKDFLATRISHQFNLRGPSIAVQTACSSSLVAVHLACLSLLSGECDMALAGGVSLCVPHHVGYWHSPGQMLSAVGHCRPFDVRADGTVFGSGVGLVVLKPLQAAIDAGDRIHAVIRGSAINNDGSVKMGFAAPSATAQADCIAEAHAVSGVDASTISYVETHGTGTPLGDPIEISGLRTAFGVSETARPGPCAIGSVKSNIGHLEVAAGIAALIKTILCLKNKTIPATLHFTSPNPELHLDETPFTVQSKTGPWESDGVRRAGVSSFGIGGTNAHVVLEEAPAEAPDNPAHTEPAGPQVLLLSAKTAAALGESRTALAAALERPGAPDLSDVAFTLAGRRKHNVTMAAVVHDREQAATVLRAAEHDNVFVGESGTDGERAEAATADRVVFLFPGQGAQHVGMAKGLYDTQPVFAEHFDACASRFGAEMGIDLKAEIFEGNATDLERIDHSQPALFTVEYALAKLVDTFGVRAGAYIGYSTGEYIAATLAGVFDLETAIKTVSLRARLMHESPAGAMVAVALSPDDVAEHLSPGVELSAVNDPGNCVVGGPKDQIRAFTQHLAERGIPVRRVRATHAFHTSAMDPMLAEFQDFLARQELRAPHTPLLSNLTGTWMSAEQVTDPTTWTRQISSTIRFADELDVVLTQPGRILVEVGPGGSLTGSAIRHPKWSSGHRAVRLMRHPIQNADDRDTFMRALGELWSAGVEVDWTPLHAERPRIVSLPGYPFERQRHWVDPKPTVWSSAPAATNGSLVPSPTNAATVEAARSGQSQTEATLQRIWQQCLGISSIDRNANFFELGGDSLMAISIAMTAANEGLTITPQDLYEHPTLASLTAAVDASFATSGLAKPPAPDAHPALLPNTAYFLERGLRDTGRWRFPLILRLDATVGAEDIRAVLTAVTNHHEALRLHLVDDAGIVEQHIAAPAEFTGLSTRPLPGDVPAGSPEERAAVSTILAEVIAEQNDSTAPLIAVHITGGQDGPHYLGLGVHEMVADDASRQILGADVLAAFGQRLAGQEITLEETTTGWRDWSLRAAALATHPAAVGTRGFWIENAREVTLWPADSPPNTDVTQGPGADDLTRLSSTLSVEQTSEVDDARRRFRRSIQEILLAALGRTIAQAVGEGVVTLELEGEGRSVLRPDVDVRRTIGWFTTYYPVPLACAKGGGAIQQLDAVHDTLKSVPHYGIGYGLLRYVNAATGRVLGAQRTPDIHFRYVGVIPELPPIDAPVQFDSDMTVAVRETIPGLGHALELRAYRTAGSLHLDWWYDTRRIPVATAEALLRTFPVALSELIHEGIAAEHEDSEMVGASEPGALVDLSSLDG